MEAQTKSHSSELLKDLAAHSPCDEREQVSIERLMSRLEKEQAKMFDQNETEHHITGSAFVVSSTGLLLHFHKKIHFWLQPGGHLEVGESALQAAERETLEETGVNARFESEIFHVDVHETPSGHVHYDIRYVAHAQSLYLRPPPNESQKVAWFSAAALSTIPDPALVGAISKLFQLKFLP